MSDAPTNRGYLLRVNEKYWWEMSIGESPKMGTGI